MFRFSIFLLFSIFSVFNVECKSSLTVLHAPKGVHFRSNHTLAVSQLKGIFETVLSYTVEAGYDWTGVEIKNPFTAAAECLLLFHLRGPNELNFPHKITLPLEEDDDISHIFSDIARDTELRYPDAEKVLLEVNIGSNNIEVQESADMKFKITKYSTETFIDEINNLKDVVDQMVVKKNKDGVPDVYWITLARIAEQRLASENMDLLRVVLNGITEKVSAMYNEKAFVAVITDDQESKTRFKRETSSNSNMSLADLNVADDYSEDFPVIFNIILWFSLALLFSLIAISMVIAGMDPGRDSIIYRMTSTRMKKDN